MAGWNELLKNVLGDERDRPIDYTGGGLPEGVDWADIPGNIDPTFSPYRPSNAIPEINRPRARTGIQAGEPSDEEIRRRFYEADRMHNIVDFPDPPSEEELARGPQLPNALGGVPNTIENAKAMILAEAEDPGKDTEQLRPYTEANAFAFPTGQDLGFDTQGYDPVAAISRGQAGNAFLNRNRTGSPIQSPPGREGILQALIQAIMSSGGGGNTFLRRNQNQSRPNW